MEPDLTTFTLEVTPAQARDFLTKNVKHNRDLRPSYVEDLANAIRRGEWVVTHQGIALDTNGRLVDGQHRCHAIIKADIPVKLRVTFDVPPDSFIAMDTGRPRAAHDVLHWSPHKTGVIRLALLLEFAPSNEVITTSQLSASEPILGPLYERVRENVTTGAKFRSAAPAYMACLIKQTTSHVDYALSTYHAFVTLDLPNIPKVGASLLKQLDTGKVSSRARWDYAARAWGMLDPNRAGVERLQVFDTTAAIKEMRAALNRHIKKVS